MATQITDINWRECEKLGSYTFLTNTDHVVRITKHSIPILFIPGIMGSRLQGSSGKVWDPDDRTFMVTNYIMTGAEKHKELLIDHQAALQVMTAENAPKDKASLLGHFRNSSDVRLDWDWLPLPAMGSPAAGTAQQRREKIAELLVNYGWGQVARGFYEQILFSLASANFGPLHRCFVFPVYARGYNWVQDNDLSGAALAGEIQKIIQAEAKIPGRECDKVIVVSHSMGGLASRSAMRLHGADGLCFGAIHGAQPVTGAPAAYRRMRAGAEGSFDPAAYVIGHTSALVMPVLAGCIGGLELLPTKLYRSDKGASAWLSQTDANGKVINQFLPASGNPYSEIYLADKGFLKLVLHPELLNPGGTERTQASKRRATQDHPMTAYRVAVRAAEKFHDQLELKAHEFTAFSYVKNGLSTYDSIDYKYLGDQQPPLMQYSEDGIPIGEMPDAQTEGSGTDLDSSLSPKAYFAIAQATGTGDGTVPVSSGKALPQSFRTPPDVVGVEHSAFYNNAAVKSFTVNSIATLAKNYRKSQVGH